MERLPGTVGQESGTISPSESICDRLLPATMDVPVAPRTPLTEPFWQACARSELLFQRCVECGRAGFPPSVACRGCLSRELTWERAAGSASLYSWTVVHRPPSPAFQPPYAPAIVTVDEGYQMLTCLIDMGVGDIRPGMRLRVAFHEARPGTTLPYFTPLPYLDPDPDVS